MNLKKYFNSLLILFFSIFIIISFFVVREKSYSENEKGIDFVFNDLNDKPLRLSDFRGNVVLVDVWATWCGPCRMEIPGFINLYKKYKDKGFEIIGISVDEDGKKAVIPFAKEYKINYPLVVEDMDNVEKVFGPIRGIPTTFLIDRDGVIKNKYIGVRPESEFEKDIKKLLEK